MNWCPSWLIVNLILLLLSIDFVHVVTSSCSNPLPLSQYYALEELYFSIHGASWCISPSQRWIFPSNISDPCTKSWFGVKCECSLDDSYSIVSLVLPGVCGHGTISSNLSALTDLQTLNLFWNAISGSIPASLGQLSGLEVINMTYNHLSAINDTIFSISSLKILALGSNDFVGTISPLISNLFSLQLLELSSNYFRGPFPSGIGNLLNLEILRISGSGLTGSLPDSLSQLSKLTEIIIVGSFDGSLPSSYKNLVNLNVVYFSASGIQYDCFAFLSGLSQVSYLYLYFPQCIDEIPDFSQFLNLTSLTLSSQWMYGSLPNNISALSLLSYMYIQSDFLGGTIPSQIGSLSSLTRLELLCPGIFGSIPSSIYSMSDLRILLLSVGVDGSIPAMVSQLRSIWSIIITSDFLSGSLPLELYTLHNLFNLHVIAGNLTGSISPMISNLTQASSITLTSPFLTGSLPTSITNLTNLNYLIISSDLMTGPLPSDIHRMNKLVSLSIYMGHLSQSIPSTFYSRISSLQALSLSGGLTGSLPSNMHVPWMYLNLSHNNLVDLVPSTFFNNSPLQSIDISYNSFTGSLPSVIALPLAYMIVLSNNYLTGAFAPSIFDDLYRINQLILNDNFFSGSLPNKFNITALQVLQIQNNHLSGNLNWLENHSSHSQLQHIDISGNQLSGTIPSSIFLLPRLTVFASTTNCFSGSLPSTLCYVRNIQSLVMDGLSSNPNCRGNKLLNERKPFFIRGFLQSNYMMGSIPSCVWNLATLKALHMSGNGFSGSIPDLLSTSLLNDVSMTNNLLSGSLPLSFQTHVFASQLALSNNRIGGSLVSNFVVGLPSFVLTLSVNRLSGTIPAVLLSSSAQDASNLQVLSGNLFGCRNGQIPQNDPDAQSYVCGSNELNNAGFTWMSIMSLLIIGIIVVVMVLKNQKTPNEGSAGCLSWFSWIIDSISRLANVIIRCENQWRIEISQIQTSPLAHQTSLFLLTLDHFRWISYLGTVAIVVFGIVVYLTLKISFSSSYSILVFQYGWIFSSAYLQGLAPTIIISIFVLLLSMFFTLSMLIHNQNCKIIVANQTSTVDPCNQDMMRSTGGQTGSLSMVEDGSQDMMDIHGTVICKEEKRDQDKSCSQSGVVISPSVTTASSSSSSSSYSSSSSITPPVTASSTATASSGCITGIINQFHPDTKAITLCVLLQAMNFLVTLTINGAYVNAVLNTTFTSLSIFILQLSLACFKVFWNMTFISHSLAHIGLSVHLQMTNRLLMSLVNFIVSPCLASLYSIESCFYFIFHEANEITSSFVAPYCNAFMMTNNDGMQCAASSNMTYSMSFVPPFLYSYQCGSEILVTYIPILIYSFTLSGLVGPVVLYLISVWKPSWNVAFLNVDGKSKMVLFLQNMALLMTFGIACPILAVVIGVSIVVESYVWCSLIGRMRFMFRKMDQEINTNEVNPLSSSSSSSSSEVDNCDDRGSQARQSSLIDKLEIDDSLRLNTMESRSNDVNMSSIDNNMNIAFKDTWRGSRSSVIMIIVVVSFFWSLLFFDMLGYSMGFTSGWIIMLCFSLSCIGLNFFQAKTFRALYNN